MADQMLQTLDPQAQAEWEAEQRKRLMAQAIMKQAMSGPQIQQPNTPLMGKISPIAGIAHVLGAYFANKQDATGAQNQANIQKRSMENTSRQLEDFYTKMSPGAVQPGTGGMRTPPMGSMDEPRPAEITPALPVDQSSEIAKALANQNPMVRAAAQALQKSQQERLFKFADVAKDAAPQIAAGAVASGKIPTESLPSAARPEMVQVPDPNNPGKFLNGVDNTGHGGIVTRTLQAPGTNVNTTVQNAPDYKSAVESRQAELEKKKTSATMAKDILSANMSAVQALEQGAQAGGLEDKKQWVRKALQGFGINSDVAASTEQLQMALGDQILTHAKKLAPVTENDLKFLEQLKGSISTDPQALTKMLSITTAAAHKDLHDYNAYLGDVKANVIPMQSSAYQDQLRALYAGQEVGYEPSKGLFGPQAFQLETARNLINKGFDPAKLEGLPPEFLKDLQKNPLMQINALGGFPGAAKAHQPLSGGKAPPPKKAAAEMSQAERDAEAAAIRARLGIK